MTQVHTQSNWGEKEGMAVSDFTRAQEANATPQTQTSGGSHSPYQRLLIWDVATFPVSLVNF